MQFFKADAYRGKRLRLSGYVKTNAVENRAALWMRIDGKDKTITELQNVTAILDRTGQVVTRSELQFKKIGIASEKLGEASESVKVFMDVIKVKPNALVWGMNEQRRSMLDQERTRHSKPTGAKKQ